MMNVNFYKNTMKKQKGFTLIELMIAMMLGLIVVGGAISIYISTITSSTDTMKMVRLNYDLNSVMQIMTNDIKRAGYSGGATAIDAGTTNIVNLFTTGDANIQAVSFGGVANTCILYTYDANNDNAVDNNEYYGFRLNGGRVDIRFAGAAANAASCSTANQWESSIDTSMVTITGLVFNVSIKCLDVVNQSDESADCSAIPTGNRAANVRYVQITLTGEVEDDSDVSLTLVENIKLHNDKVYLAP